MCSRRLLLASLFAVIDRRFEHGQARATIPLNPQQATTHTAQADPLHTVLIAGKRILAKCLLDLGLGFLFLDRPGFVWVNGYGFIRLEHLRDRLKTFGK